ncbi:Rai14 [Symbiodinium sp. CCMP2592]|nr:Rai14 [Symbiodinium sp. CCMP2592]
MEPAATVLGHPEARDGESAIDLQEWVPLERSSFFGGEGEESLGQAELEGEGSSSLSEEGEESPGQGESLVESIAEIISKMEPTRTEAVRATRVHNALRCLARPLRYRGDFYHLSQSTSRLDAFWSHSWHGSVSGKVATLFFLHNARAATTAGTGAAVVACLAFGLGVLPDRDGDSWWCLSFGCIAYSLTMLLWRPRELVFVDRVCISQVDPKLQAEGTFSLGAILKRTDTLLVLWDPSWARRLWCVYELAAFIRSRTPGEKPRIIIRPTILGFIMGAAWFALALGGFAFHWAHSIEVDSSSGLNDFALLFIGIACCGLFFWYIVHIAREYCREITIMYQHIRHFRVATAESLCCAVNHRLSGSDEPIMCDREVMQKCINIWFGGIEAFEQHVQSDLCDLLVDQLANHMVSYWRLAEASPVFFWFFLDIVAHHLCYFVKHVAEDGSFPWGILRLFAGLSFWLGLVPILVRVMFRLAWAMQAKCACRLLDYFKSLFLLLPGVSIFGAFVFLDYFLTVHLPYDLGSLTFALITIPLAALVWQSLPVPVPDRN